ncbi:MAG: hypothetical protein FJ403_08315 [Verrucomicrobia bacterium]|nr:hypothetical protein [Verrucomicrobiota bacterium]
MRRLLIVTALAATLLPANAQLFSRESLGGAALGGLAGGIIGHNSGRKTAEGAAIGAGAGLLLGALTHNARRDYYYGAQAPVAPAPTYYHGPVRPNYAITGAALGGLAGGVIGHNHHRQTAEGIAIGAGAGLLLGSIVEQNARRPIQYVQPAPAYVVAQPQPVVQSESTTAPAVPAPTSAPQQVNVINSSAAASSSMSSANSLFGR